MWGVVAGLCCHPYGDGAVPALSVIWRTASPFRYTVPRGVCCNPAQPLGHFPEVKPLPSWRCLFFGAPCPWRAPAGSGLSWAVATKAFPPPDLSWGRKKCSRTLENTDFSQDSKLAQASSPPLALSSCSI